LAPCLLHQCVTTKEPMKVNMIPRKKLAIFFAAFGALMLAFSQNASACRHPLPPVTLASAIDGSITFAGAVQFDINSLATATRVNTWFDSNGNAGFSTVQLGATGAFAGILAGTQATMAQPWIFNPSTPTPGLWSVGGFTFDLLSSTVVTHIAAFLNITGTGIISGNGFDPTAGTWSFSSQTPGGPIFSFSASSSTVPDGGSAVALLGIAFIGVEVLRRKLKAA
jgi:hypothetical protein